MTNVTTQTGLNAALDSAVPGDTIELADGFYGEWWPSVRFTDYITIRSKNPLGARFGIVGIYGCSYIEFVGVECLDLKFPNYKTNDHIRFVSGKMRGFYASGAGNHSHVDIIGNTIGKTGKDTMQNRFHHCKYIVFSHERHFDIELIMLAW